MKCFHMKSALCFGDTIVPKRRANDKLPATPEGKREFFLEPITGSDALRTRPPRRA